MSKNLKCFSTIMLFFVANIISLSSFGAEFFLQVLQEPNNLIAAVYEAAGVKKEDARVVIFEYDYLKEQWHIELTPTAISCIDCYPSFYIENKPLITVVSIPHG